MAEGIKKPPVPQWEREVTCQRGRRDLRYHAEKQCHVTSDRSPGSWVQKVGPSTLPPAFPDEFVEWLEGGRFPLTVAGPRRIFTGLPCTPFRASERLFSYRVRYIPQTRRHCQSEIQTYESNSTTESNRLSSPPRPAHKDKVRPHLKRLHLAATSFQCRQDRQSGRRLADTAMGAGDDQSREIHRLLHSLVCEFHTAIDRPNRGAEI